VTPEARSRLRRVPRVKRARGYRLYTYDGRRMLDLWQAAGQAILGHRGAGVATRVKAVLDRGLLVALPTPAEHRLERALGRLFAGLPGSRFAVFADRERAVEAVAAALGRRADECRPIDPVRLALALEPEVASPRVFWWRPFVPVDFDPAARADAGVLFPILPAGSVWGAQPVVYPSALGIELESDLIAEPALAALTVAADALVSAPDRASVSLHGFASAGPYLMPMQVVGSASRLDSGRADDGASDAAYGEVFDRFLGAGVLLSPDPAIPSIYPAEASDGERSLLNAVARGE